MSNFGLIVDRVIEKSDIVLEVLDARFINETKNPSIERKVKNKNKILIQVINKCDYVDKNYLDKIKRDLENCVFVSATKHLGTTMLKQKIRALANMHKIKRPLIGVVGYPNVGKSSIINALKGRGSARTSPEAGFTKGAQNIRVSKDFFVIDTPGVIGKGKDQEELVLIGAKNPYAIKDPDLAVIKLIENNPGLIEKKYGVAIKKDKEEVIEEIALKLNFKKKGNLADTERASKMILSDWINGKIF